MDLDGKPNLFEVQAPIPSSTNLKRSKSLNRHILPKDGGCYLEEETA
jgi:hypothetical protein